MKVFNPASNTFSPLFRFHIRTSLTVSTCFSHQQAPNVRKHFRQFARFNSTMSLFKKITTPNGLEYEQPLGLFINGEVVGGNGNGGKRIAAVDPA